jgi:hypothetical protein
MIRDTPYKTAENLMGFNPGDSVKVIFKDDEKVDRGWDDCWSSYMDRFVLQTGTVSHISDNDGGICVEFKNGDNWYFPYYCLLKV